MLKIAGKPFISTRVPASPPIAGFPTEGVNCFG